MRRYNETSNKITAANRDILSHCPKRSVIKEKDQIQKNRVIGKNTDPTNPSVDTCHAN